MDMMDDVLCFGVGLIQLQVIVELNCYNRMG